MKEVYLKNNETVTLRKVAETDADVLFHFLNNLSQEALSTFAPHAFDESTVRQVCENSSTGDTHHYLALAQGGRCIAYSLLKTGIIWHDADRLQQYGMNPTEHYYGTFAPCVAGNYYGTGLAPALLNHMEAEARMYGMNRLVLWGGVQKDNFRAVRFYEKSGFRTVGEFEYHGHNLDMVKDIF